MGLDTRHPLYVDMEPFWIIMSDCYAGERKVKAARAAYLPPTAGMTQDGLVGYQSGALAYNAYLKRATMPDLVTEAVETSVGIMNKKPASIELPQEMEYLRENATLQNQSLDLLLRQIHMHQLITGRAGLFVDINAEESAENEPYLAFYTGSKIINWDKRFIILDESGIVEGTDFTWNNQKSYRVLEILDGEYRTAVFSDAAAYDRVQLVAPFINSRARGSIPFTFINSKDLLMELDEPPLMGLSFLTLSMYRQDADYKQALFLQGQDTLVVTGAANDGTIRIGAGAHISVPLGADAKFIGVDGSGLEEQRRSLENDYQRASGKGGQLLDTNSHERESGDALNVRVSARTASLHQLAMAASGGLQSALRQIADWKNLDPESVIVKPNLDFTDSAGMSRSLLELLDAKSRGAPISLQSVHDWMQKHDLTEINLEDELRLIAGETVIIRPSTPPSQDE